MLRAKYQVRYQSATSTLQPTATRARACACALGTSLRTRVYT
jgi:hypothetical protein